MITARGWSQLHCQDIHCSISCACAARSLSTHTHAAHARSRCRCSACASRFLTLEYKTALRTPAEIRPVPPFGSRRDSASLGSLFSTGGLVGKMKSNSCFPKGSLPPFLKNGRRENIKMTRSRQHTRTLRSICVEQGDMHAAWDT